MGTVNVHTLHSTPSLRSAQHALAYLGVQEPLQQEVLPLLLFLLVSSSSNLKVILFFFFLHLFNFSVVVFGIPAYWALYLKLITTPPSLLLQT